VSQGTGIGLYAVKILSESLQGMVTLTSIEGKGSKFEVLLPLTEETKKNNTVINCS
jgi:sensor histidine kinase regulating citrate/malate metabolism